MLGSQFLVSLLSYPKGRSLPPRLISILTMGKDSILIPREALHSKLSTSTIPLTPLLQNATFMLTSYDSDCTGENGGSCYLEWIGKMLFCKNKT